MKAVFGNSFYDFESLILKQVEDVGVLPEKFEETISFDDAKEKIKNYLFVQNKQIAFAEYIKELRDNATIENL